MTHMAACILWSRRIAVLGSRSTLRQKTSPKHWLGGDLLSAVLATSVAIALMNRWQKELPPVRAAILYALEPVWAALFAVALGRADATKWLWIGGVCLIVGNLVATPARGRERSRGRFDDPGASPAGG